MTQVFTPPACPIRPNDGHKGTFGTVVVIGGRLIMPGAPALCALASLRSGAGLAKVMTPADALQTVIALAPSATGAVLPAEVDEMMPAIERVDPKESAVLAVGPGAGQSDAMTALVRKLINGRRPVVLDADGLNALAAGPDVERFSDTPLVLTPHPGEFRRLAEAMHIPDAPDGELGRVHAAEELARRLNAVVVLKGSRSVVADGKRFYVNDTGNVAMATAGSGDVLTGVISALMAQGMTPFDAAALGVFLHGKAGDMWAGAHGRSGMLAGDLIDLLPDAFERHRG